MGAGNVCLKKVPKHWDVCILSETHWPILYKQYVVTEARQRDVSKKYGLKVKMSQRGRINQAFSGHFLPNGRTECLLYLCSENLLLFLVRSLISSGFTECHQIGLVSSLATTLFE